jgi:hypothetical protein
VITVDVDVDVRMGIVVVCNVPVAVVGCDGSNITQAAATTTIEISEIKLQMHCNQPRISTQCTLSQVK